MTDNTPAPESVTPEAVAGLARRLRGEYRIPITDGLGPAGGEEPDNEHEFVRTFATPPIQKDAAATLEALAADLAAQKARADAAEAETNKVRRFLKISRDEGGEALARAAAADAKVARLVEALDSLLDAITAENEHRDRALIITGPTANLKWLIEACDDARAAIAEVQG